MSLVRTKKQSPIKRIESIINENEDITMLESFSGLIKDMIHIENLDDEILRKQREKEELQSNMYKEESRVMLSFFLAGLDSAEIASVGDKIKGRIGTINRLKEAASAKEASSDAEEDSHNNGV